MESKRCFYCDPKTRKDCDTIIDEYKNSICHMIEKKNPEIKEPQKTTFSLECPEHGILAIGPLEDMSKILDEHGEACEKKEFMILPQRMFESYMDLL